MHLGHIKSYRQSTDHRIQITIRLLDKNKKHPPLPYERIRHWISGASVAVGEAVATVVGVVTVVVVAAVAGGDKQELQDCLRPRPQLLETAAAASVALLQSLYPCCSRLQCCYHRLLQTGCCQTCYCNTKCSSFSQKLVLPKNSYRIFHT